MVKRVFSYRCAAILENIVVTCSVTQMILDDLVQFSMMNRTSLHFVRLNYQ